MSGSAFSFALGIADADRIGASAKVQTANPINRSRFMMCYSLDRVIAVMNNAHGNQIVPWMRDRPEKPRRPYCGMPNCFAASLAIS